MKNEKNNAKKHHDMVDSDKNLGSTSGYPLYPASEDIYLQFTQESGLDPENTGVMKPFNEPFNSNAESDLLEGELFSDFDVPGADLDDEQEDIGNEDEENNYYSLGGDNHNDLEENLN